MIKTDIIIIGAGPVGLFAVFEAGLLKMKCHLIDVLPKAGGQCIELYPKKPIYDIPAHPEILAGDLIEKLIKQSSQFKPGFTLGEKAEKLEKNKDGTFTVTTDKGTKHNAPVVAIAGGLGGFQPRKPNFDGIENFENKGILYFIKDPKIFHNKNIVISGGGDSALDWALELSKYSQITLIHRRNEFRGAQHTLSEIRKLEKNGKLAIKTPCQIISLDNEKNLKSITIKFDDEKTEKIPTDFILSFFGLVMKLGPIAEWGLNMDKKTIEVNPKNFETNRKGIFAVGDICSYPGKLKLILSGFHEVALASVECFKRARPNEKYRFEFTTSSKTIQDRLGKK